MNINNNNNEVNVVELLSYFNEYRLLNIEIEYDLAHLLSGYTFNNNIAGYASVGTLCIDVTKSSGINSILTSNNNLFNAAIIAHEIGHNLGMLHDSTNNDCTLWLYYECYS